jgi:hypothetical protein
MYNAAFAGMYTPVAELVVLSDADVVKALTIVAQNNATTAVSAGRCVVLHCRSDVVSEILSG